MIPKFRAWDKVNERIVEVSEINFWTKVIDTTDTFLAFSNVELLQSTGLSDKNGKEIFESQIVDIYTLEGTIYLRGIVKKVKGGFYIEELYHSKIIPLTDFYFKSYTNTLEIEILGNKFEHPHLLGED